MILVAAILIIITGVIGSYLYGKYWSRSHHKSLGRWLHDGWETTEDPETERRHQFYNDTSRISVLIYNAYRPEQWREIEGEIHLFSMMFASYQETKGIIDKWHKAIKDSRTKIAMGYRNEPNDFN